MSRGGSATNCQHTFPGLPSAGTIGGLEQPLALSDFADNDCSTAAAGASGNSVKDDEAFFRIVHTAVARHRVAIQGCLAGTIQVLPTLDVQTCNGKKRYTLSLNLAGRQDHEVSVALWLSSTNVKQSELMKGLKQWAIHSTGLSKITLSNAKHVLRVLQSHSVHQGVAEHTLQLLASCGACSSRGQPFVPNVQDE